MWSAIVQYKRHKSINFSDYTHYSVPIKTRKCHRYLMEIIIEKMNSRLFWNRSKLELSWMKSLVFPSFLTPTMSKLFYFYESSKFPQFLTPCTHLCLKNGDVIYGRLKSSHDILWSSCLFNSFLLTSGLGLTLFQVFFLPLKKGRP